MDISKTGTTTSNPTHILPSFFKILLDDSNPNLPLPPAFVKKQFLGDEFPENPVLETEFGGKWKVKIEKIGGKICFVNGWLQFVEDTKTEVGDFLVFWLIGKSTFKVSIFGPNACAKDLRFATPTNYKCSYDCSGSGNSDADLKNKIEIEDEEDDDDVDDKIKVEEDYDFDDFYEDMDEVKNDYDFKEEDIDDDDDDDDEDDTDSEDEYDDEEDEVKEIKVQRFNQKEECLNPIFKKVLTKSYCYEMILPRSFVKEAGLESKEKVVISNKEMKRWSVKIGRRTRGEYYLANGWVSFWKENNLMEGDTCSFKYVHGEDGRESYIEFDVVKNVAPKRGRPKLDNSVSYQIVGKVVKKVEGKAGDSTNQLVDEDVKKVAR